MFHFMFLADFNFPIQTFILKTEETKYQNFHTDASSYQLHKEVGGISKEGILLNITIGSSHPNVILRPSLLL